MKIEQIIDILRNNSNYWISRKLDDDTYDNLEIDDAQEGDVVWFNKDATQEDMLEVKKVLTQRNLHMYSKNLAEKGKMIYSKSGAFSFLVLPNQAKWSND